MVGASRAVWLHLLALYVLCLKPRLATNLSVAESEPTTLEHVYIGVKTTGKYHDSRLPILLQTWFTGAVREQAFFFSDREDEKLQTRSGKRLYVTNCGATHGQADLCCKTEAMLKELARYGTQMGLEGRAPWRWVCTFDDDNYVNAAALVEMLQKYDSNTSVYLGRPSTGQAVHNWFEARTQPIKLGSYTVPKASSFWFATGGAGVCFSRALVDRVFAFLEETGPLSDICVSTGLPDDMVLGFLSELVLTTNLSHQSEIMHSHLESLYFHRDAIPKQVTLSYGMMAAGLHRVQFSDGDQPGDFSVDDDVSRFKTVHCILHPHLDWCVLQRKGLKPVMNDEL